MNKKQHGKRKKLRQRKKLRRLVIAYLLRAIVILIAIIMMILMVCGCLYIYDKFTKEDRKIDIYANTYTDTNAGNDTAPVFSATDTVSKFCVIIDAGHGGSDGGTVSGKIIEKDINLSVALKLKAILEDNNMHAFSMSQIIKRQLVIHPFHQMENTN